MLEYNHLTKKETPHRSHEPTTAPLEGVARPLLTGYESAWPRCHRHPRHTHRHRRAPTPHPGEPAPPSMAWPRSISAHHRASVRRAR
eukprot:scaffold23588_cov25-Tisochrysis_lutea.AAC.3